MSDPPDDDDRDPGADPDRREPHPDRRGTDTDRRATDTDRRRTDRREADADRRTAERHEADAIRDRTGRHGRDPTTSTDALADRDERAGGHADDRRDRGADAGALRWLSGVVSLVGLWLAASAFVYETTRAALWNNVVVGVAIFLLAGYGFYRLARDHRPDVGSTGLAALLGLWAIASPFLLAYPSDAHVWSTVASGIAITVLSGYNAYESRRASAAGSTGSRA